MEQMSSDEHLGSLAEAVLEALKSHPGAGAKVAAVRSATREEKKKMAMAMRAKQLAAIGLKTNDKGQVFSLKKFLNLIFNLKFHFQFNFLNSTFIFI